MRYRVENLITEIKGTKVYLDGTNFLKLETIFFNTIYLTDIFCTNPFSQKKRYRVENLETEIKGDKVCLDSANYLDSEKKIFLILFYTSKS